MNNLLMVEETSTLAMQNSPAPCNNSLQGIIERTTDLPHGGNWWVVDLDCKDQWQELPEWLIKRGVWLLQNKITQNPPWYAFMPATVGGQR